MDWAISVAPTRILDLGCGTGLALAGLAGSLPGTEVVGLDLSMAMLRQAEQSAAIRELVQGSVEDLPFGARSFDLVSALGLMDYVQDPAAVLTGIRQILLPAGHLVFTYPSGDSWARASRDAVRRLAGRSSSVRALPLASRWVDQLLERNGFLLVRRHEITYGNGLLTLPWSRALNRWLERRLGPRALRSRLAWSCFCVARREA